MKKIIRFVVTSCTALAFSVLMVSALGQSVSAQSATGNGIKVSPVRTDLTIEAGKSESVVMTIQNITSDPAEFEAIINDFVTQDDSGAPALILDSDKYAPSHSLKRYIAPVPKVMLQPGESKDVKVTINIPADAAGGGYYGAVRFSPNGERGSRNVTLTANVASIILVKVPGDIKNDMKLDYFDVRKGEKGVGGSSFFTGNKDLYSSFRFKNDGNTHEQPFGKVRLLKGSEVLQETEINNTDPRASVIPDSKRRFDVKLDKVGSFGKYTVEGNFGYSDNGQLLTGKTTFWVVPLPIIIAALVLVAVLVALAIILPKMKRSRNRANIRRAGRR